MKYLKQFIGEGYDKNHKCKTPGAMYNSTITDKKIGMMVELPFKVSLSEKEADDLEADLHYVIEKVLSPLFKNKN